LNHLFKKKKNSRFFLMKEPSNDDDALTMALYGEYLLDIKNDYTAAIPWFERAVSRDPHDTWVRSLYADALLDAKDAEVQYRAALECDGTHPLALGNLGELLIKDPLTRNEAIELLERNVEHFPDHVSSLVQLGNAHKSVDTSRAESYFKKAIQCNPDHAKALGGYAVVKHGLRKDREAAQMLYARALFSDPYNANLLSNYGLFLTEVEHEHDKAEELYIRGLRVDPKHANTHCNYGVLMDSVQKNKNGAIECYRKAVASNPKHAFAWYNLAVLLEQEKRYDEAESAFKRSLVAAPSDPKTLTDYGNFLNTIRRDSKQAETYYLKSLMVSNESYAPAFYGLGTIHKNQFRFEEAKSCYEKCLMLDNTHCMAYGSMATLYLDVFELPKRAEELYVKALQLEPENVEHLVNYADLLSDALNDPKAMHVYEKASRLAPNNSYVAHNFALFLVNKQQRKDLAKNILENILALTKSSECETLLAQISKSKLQVISKIK